ncbi:MAG: hypothetical protein M1379_10930 [Firmicutes bacterium]|nr:hypothetical protein [Bacillota bacterium]
MSEQTPLKGNPFGPLGEMFVSVASKLDEVHASLMATSLFFLVGCVFAFLMAWGVGMKHIQAAIVYGLFIVLFFLFVPFVVFLMFRSTRKSRR